MRDFFLNNNNNLNIFSNFFNKKYFLILDKMNFFFNSVKNKIKLNKKKYFLLLSTPLFFQFFLLISEQCFPGV